MCGSKDYRVAVATEHSPFVRYDTGMVSFGEVQHVRLKMIDCWSDSACNFMSGNSTSVTSKQIYNILSFFLLLSLVLCSS